MNAAHVHLLIAHVPVIGIVVATLLLALAAWRKTPESRWNAYVAVIVVGAAAAAVYISGGGAEHLVENIAGVDTNIIEKHQDLAKLALIGAGLLALAGVVAFVRPALGRQPSFLFLTLTGSIILDVLFGIVANAGGVIRHSEIIGH